MTEGKFSGRDTTKWRGIRISQCPLCFELFSGEGTFVLHRIEAEKVNGCPARYMLGPCRDPLSKGLTLSRYGFWSLPAPPESYLGRLNAENTAKTV